MNGHFKNLIAVLAVIGALTAATSATAIDRYRFVPLPHLGFGGEALGVFFGKVIDVEGRIVGRVGTSSTTQGAALWRPDGSGGFTLTLLPGIGGPNSSANSITRPFVDGLLLIVGEAQTPAGVMKPVLWTQQPDGSFTPHVLPTLGGAVGEVRGIYGTRRNGDQVVFLVGTSQTPTGEMHATLWGQLPPDRSYRAIDLGTLGAANSEARGITLQTDTGDILVVGRAQTPSGAWHACSWDIDNDGTEWWITDRHPGGASSELTGLSASNGGIWKTGNVLTANGRSAGFWTQNEFPANILMAPGFHNTSASACDGRTYGNLTVGQAWNNPANMHAVAWNTIADLGRTTPYPLAAIIRYDWDWTSPFNFSARAAGPGVIVGSYTDPQSPLVIPIALMTDGTLLPDLVNVTMGAPEPNFSETDLWRDGDGKTLRIKTRNADGDRATVETRYYASTGAIPAEIVSLDIRARIVGSPDATAQAEIDAYNFDTGMWEFVSITQPFVDGLVVNFAAAGRVNPATGEVRVRLNFTPLTGKIKGVEIDSIRVVLDVMG